MKLIQPYFWQKGSKKPLHWLLLWLASFLYYMGFLLRCAFTKTHKIPYRSICVGNAVAGGAGKTPVLIALARLLGEENVVFITRGYGGHITDATLVTDYHEYKDVGDEALLLARHAPTIVAADRIKGAEMAHALAPRAILLFDDGMQNPHFRAKLNLLVWDAFESGNGHMIPAGPLRQPLKAALKLADVIVTLDDRQPPQMPAFSAHGAIEPPLAPQQVLAFAGIGRPEKFRESLKKAGFLVTGFGAFADHHAYTDDELRAQLHPNYPTLTTEKDYVRIPLSLRDHIIPVPYMIHFSHPQALRTWLTDHLSK